MKKIALVIALAIASLSSAQAENAPESGQQLRFVVGTGLTFGGDKLATAKYTNGGSIDVRAGGMVAFVGGVDYRINQQFSFQGTVGFHFDQADAKNGNVNFRRYPIEVLGYFHPTEKFRVGGGVRYVAGPKLSGSGYGSGIDTDFDNAVGAVVEGEYFFSQNVGVKLRFVKEEYKDRMSYMYRGVIYNDKVKGDHVGIFGNFYF
ncbi:hypothetical protein RBA41_13760 [Massilia sp. CCM 9210]|uniref:outer membrane beta-barrel protein n=1 Tax=Massilia scottii TaxID=3057166 RepID=UPI002796D8E8|nr:outer membrane beta-barrel protein [Massilia sp. CCM 9210]MDQ1814375.1 hypothetical protein [Massilia sp. CCM 9210]